MLARASRSIIVISSRPSRDCTEIVQPQDNIAAERFDMRDVKFPTSPEEAADWYTRGKQAIPGGVCSST
ncbi:MAG: hypothetical protein JWM11_865, partial [Planctomycetaceae bacterium]|nr:hypothetical protein [Planctomycetaceae bacterium]